MVPDNKKGSKTACDMNKGDRSQFEDWPNDQILDNLSNKINTSYNGLWGFPGGTGSKEPIFQWRRLKRCRFKPWVGKIPWRRAWQPIPVFLPGECHGQRSLEGYYSDGHKELDTTEATEHIMDYNSQIETTIHKSMWI